VSGDRRLVDGDAGSTAPYDSGTGLR
jgi:hypothetical protein